MTDTELKEYLELTDPAEQQALYRKAYEVKLRRIGAKVSLRGLIEISNICKNDCFYCGIRRSNHRCRRYRLTEEEILSVIERATVEMCMNESRAREKLARKAGAQLYDKIARSYGVLTNAYMLTSAELMSLISDVKLGVILNILPLKDTKTLDKLLVFCSAANLALQMGNASAGERDIVRAALVKRTLEGGAQR